MKTPSVPVTTSSVSDTTHQSVKKLLDINYGINVSKVEQFDEKTASSDVYLCTVEGQEPVVLKYIYWYVDPSSKGESNGLKPLLCAYQVSERLREGGVQLPAVYTNKDNMYITEADDGLLVVLQYMDGDHFVPSEKSFYTSGQALGILHTVGLELIKKDPYIGIKINSEMPTEKPYINSRTQYDASLKEKLLGVHECTFPDMCKAFRDNIDSIDAAIALVDSARMFDNERPSGIVHFDFHVNNGLFKEDGSFVCFLDIDQLSVGSFIGEIGNTLVSFISNALNNDPNCNVEEYVGSFLRGYHEKNPLPFSEYTRILPAGLMYDIMRVLRSLRRHRFEDDRLSGLYPTVAARSIPRFKELPKAFNFITGDWIKSQLIL